MSLNFVKKLCIAIMGLSILGFLIALYSIDLVVPVFVLIITLGVFLILYFQLNYDSLLDEEVKREGEKRKGFRTWDYLTGTGTVLLSLSVLLLFLLLI